MLFCDQRGVGRSEPHGCLEHNTTQDLIKDMIEVLQPDRESWNLLRTVLLELTQ